MIADLLRALTAPTPQAIPADDSHLALAALLVRIARSDGIYDASEVARIDAVLQTRFEMTPAAAAEMRRDAERVEAEAPDTVRFTRAIKDSVPYGEREGVIEALWEIVLADGVRDHEEDALLRLVAPMLGVTDQDSAHARRRIEARQG
ncbi:TerB family tellurite resistance protein [Salibaculum sp.]|uniref:tellurite resistance TerB family protein n=1 Tax=Salibaculum sp. TaxID=2855480 RepID=UPI002B45E438|nr:TerB family tellurite resistance protein [Salibaculum sp.]HKL68629.1 TerB family tellurite resistance protein [Salibaculum sp.]